ncbi:MAG TPA: alpha-hydroxy acid oxidase [Gaiellaceae bacterium]|nr:alpha-hydroxy acid oxidase [Gaiellaceae bacterium]
MSYLNVADYEREAERLLDPVAFAYFAGGSGDEWTLRDNVAAFRRWRLRPRMLVEANEPSATTAVLGAPVSLPVLLAPVGFQQLAHREGELAVARAAASVGTVYCHATLSSLAPNECAEAVPECARWFQLYWSRDRGFTRDLLQRVAEAGYGALVLTVDLPVLGRRERDLRLGINFPPGDVPLPNVSPELQPLGQGFGHVVDATLTWRDLEWLRKECSLPLAVKGILTAEDAVLAADHGAAAVVVSNHGGRQLDGVPASLDVLPEVVEAVGDRVEVLLDGGVRRGIDVLVALALGARAVLVGRPFLWGLAVDGEQGVLRILELFHEEVLTGLTLLGCATPAGVTRAHVAKRD